jgi:TetR/AcrR family transcriptional regulator
VTRPKLVKKRDSLQTQRKIVCAAQAEFALHGFDGARLTKIADRAGLSRQIIYHYYRSKSELLDAILRDESEDSVTRLACLDFNAGSPIEILRQFVMLMFDLAVTSSATVTLDALVHKGDAARIPGRLTRPISSASRPSSSAAGKKARSARA